MTHVPHDLADEFPEHADKMKALKQEGGHFARLADEYHEINREIHRIETDVTPTSDAYQEEMRKKRLKLKDEIFHMLTA